MKSIIIIVSVLSLLLSGCAFKQSEDSLTYANNVIQIQKQGEYYGCTQGCEKLYKKLNYTGINLSDININPNLVIYEECRIICR